MLIALCSVASVEERAIKAITEDNCISPNGSTLVGKRKPLLREVQRRLTQLSTNRFIHPLIHQLSHPKIHLAIRQSIHPSVLINARQSAGNTGPVNKATFRVQSLQKSTTPRWTPGVERSGQKLARQPTNQPTNQSVDHPFG